VIDLAAAAQFMAAHARAVDRRRFDLLTGSGSVAAVLRALRAYQNDDGGIGLLEPDARPPDSQPSAALYAIGILDEIGAADDPLGPAILDWLQTVTGDDGGVPFVLPSAAAWPHAPWFAAPEDDASSLLMTAGLVAHALRLGLAHPWVAGASAYCWDQIAALTLDHGYTVRAALAFLDATPDRPRAEAQLDAIAERLPPSGVLPVAGGVEGEVLGALDVAPRPDHAARRLFADDLVERELDALAAAQRDDGGWTFSWPAWNPAAALEWRGIVTIEALATLRAYDRL
jgi:hypothetical protein